MASAQARHLRPDSAEAGQCPWSKDRKGRKRKYLNVFPSKKAVQREREKLHDMTDSHQCFKPIAVLTGELNRQLRGWASYFSCRYPMSAYCEIERHVQGRLIRPLQRRSQRPYGPGSGESWLPRLVRRGERVSQPPAGPSSPTLPALKRRSREFESQLSAPACRFRQAGALCLSGPR